ncbi:RDD family protein [Marinirhabdus gelatinilytica]|uniref:Putative RDD family membrane protein YckC n=1 Tax=Marinirhabdus gelatinilytica TaxID=1703343 RepID=A0A370QFE3_9FLAO|nr:RDD family protein [Marinirhabdus gelatinilytica]RDK87084.1 putative RDD family membrane protein YckC [Marinirhabdus gelatinilytica]
MDNFQIETAQNVNIAQNVGGVGERVLAFIIDYLIIFVYIILASIAISALEFDSDYMFLVYMTAGLPIFTYSLLWETFWNGRSPGKALLKLRVVKLDGSKPAFSNYFIRWLLRIIDVTITSGALALVTVLLNGKGQRLGDIAASTTVITEKKTVSLSQTLVMDLPEDYTPRYPQVTVFTDAEMSTVKSLFWEAKYNGNHGVVLKLKDRLSKVMEVTPEEKPIAFVDKVIKDYNYYTQNM